MHEKPQLILIANPEKRETVAAGREFRQRIPDRADIIADNFDKPLNINELDGIDYVVVFGGDGTILSTVRSMKHRQIPIMGVNMGKLGFLAEFGIDDLDDEFEQIIALKAPYSRRAMLDCRIDGPQREVFQTTVVNEIAITAGPPFRMIEVSISIAEDHLACCAGDGLIVSTPTGSTAYNLSAGGPILESSLQAAAITPLAAHSLSFRPIVVDLAEPIRLRCHDLRPKPEQNEHRGVVVVIDGQSHTIIKPEDTVTITQSPAEFMLVQNQKQSQWGLLSTKLNWGILPNYGPRDRRCKT